jgi:hypothetical protein
VLVKDEDFKNLNLSFETFLASCRHSMPTLRAMVLYGIASRQNKNSHTSITETKISNYTNDDGIKALVVDTI